MTAIKVADEIRTLEPYKPGKPIAEVERELGIREALKLASNENPLGPSPRGMAAAREALKDIHRYPDGNSHYLKEKLSAVCTVKPGNIIIGNGSNEVIEVAVRTFLRPGDEVVTSAHAFIVYRLISQATGGRVIEVPMGDDLKFDIPALCRAVTDRTKMIFIANPNNPTGTWCSAEEIRDIAAFTAGKGILLVIDQAYQEYVTTGDWEDATLLMEKYPHVMVVRTFSKIYGLAGLRCGYGIAREELIDYMNRVRQPFNVNSVTQAAALAALDDREHLEKSLRVNREGMAFIAKRLDDLGLRHWPSQANFILFDLERNSLPVYEAMLRKGIILRPMENYGLPETLRISIGTEEENRTAMDALSEILKR